MSERYSYNTESLQRSVDEFERVYGITSAEFAQSYLAGHVPDGVPRFEAHVWMSFIEDIARLRGVHPLVRKRPVDGDTIARVSRTFAYAS